MQPERPLTGGRAPYEKPRLRRIELAAEEVLAKGCKTYATTAPNQMSPPCTFAMCAQLGS